MTLYRCSSDSLQASSKVPLLALLLPVPCPQPPLSALPAPTHPSPFLSLSLCSPSQVRRLPGAHDAGITALYCPAPGLLASGDEDGMLKLWDIRAKKAVGESLGPVRSVLGHRQWCLGR